MSRKLLVAEEFENLHDVADDMERGRCRHLPVVDVKTVRPDTPVSEAVQVLSAVRFGCLPVVDEGGVLLGIVSEVDLLRLLAGFLNLDERSFDSAREFHRSPALNRDE